MHDMQTTFRAGHLIRWQYRVINLLGQEAANAVYLVADEHTTHQKQFALKEVMYTLREERGGFPFNAAAFKRLYHPALPRIYRLFHSDDHERFYILMDYVEGSSLEAIRRVMPGKRFTLHAALTLMTPVMDAVSYLHRQHPHLIHGDIKPSNIIVPIAARSTPSKLVDFGGVTNLIIDATASERLARGGAGEPDPLLPMDQFTPTDQIVAHAICRALSISRLDRFDSVEQFREALWQVIHANPMITQKPELEVVVPAREQTELDTEPDDAKPEVETPATITNAAVREEVTSTDALS